MNRYRRVIRGLPTLTGALVVALTVACSAQAGNGPAAADPTRSPTRTTAPASVAATHAATPVPLPPISEAARAVGFVDVRTVVPDAVIDLRYATTNNFVGVRLYPANARCLIHESLAAGLRAAAARLRTSGETLVFWDCYRPHSVQVTMFQEVPNPAWVAAPGPYSRSHESGRSVDVTLATRRSDCPADRRVDGHCLVDMGTDFDSFTPAATAFATEGVSPAAQRSRARLRDAMAAGGLSVYSGEWWHFDGPGAGVHRPIIDVPLT
ncbi:M15 family metallopeptidase [Gordonia sp. VNQ95]|uniref:M15 family metallopeptidase n=1 Tax=Gordonia TaxID=2053 RepID=UPI0032B510A8